MRRAVPVLLICMALAACGGVTGVYRDTDVQISSAAAFDPARYQGRWYEVARYPVPFQAGCVGTTADYALKDDGTIAVVNTCKVDGKVKQVVGEADIVGPGRLAVSFSSVPFVKAPYWVLWVDADYRTAVVGVPSGRAGWILNRAPQIPPDRWRAALEILQFNGYDLGSLQRTPQPGG